MSFNLHPHQNKQFIMNIAFIQIWMHLIKPDLSIQATSAHIQYIGFKLNSISQVLSAFLDPHGINECLSIEFA